MNGVEVAGGPFDPEVCDVHWRQKEKQNLYMMNMASGVALDVSSSAGGGRG